MCVMYCRAPRMDFFPCCPSRCQTILNPSGKPGVEHLEPVAPCSVAGAGLSSLIQLAPEHHVSCRNHHLFVILCSISSASPGRTKSTCLSPNIRKSFVGLGKVMFQGAQMVTTSLRKPRFTRAKWLGSWKFWSSLQPISLSLRVNVFLINPS